MKIFFKKLLGLTEPNSVQPINEKSLPISTNELIENNKTYDIGEVKKQSTKIKDEDGFRSSINFIKKFIDSNNIEFKELIMLFKKIIPYMKSEKTISDSDITSYVIAKIDAYDDKDNIENIVTIAELLCRVSNLDAIEFLEMRLGGFESDVDKDSSFFEAMILLSDYYLKIKKTDKSFQTTRRALRLLDNITNRFDYLSKHKIIADCRAKICLNGQKQPEYPDYLYYQIIAAILEIAKEVALFPHFHTFYQKKESYLDGWFKDNADFDLALDYLKITEHTGNFLNELYDFAFNKFPTDLGIPSEYLSINYLNSLYSSNNQTDNYPERKKVTMISMNLTQITFEEINSINEFASLLIKKHSTFVNGKSKGI